MQQTVGVHITKFLLDVRKVYICSFLSQIIKTLDYIGKMELLRIVESIIPFNFTID